MDINALWEKALKRTEIIRSRIQGLHTYADTHVPYIFLAESAFNAEDTVVRKGEVVVQKPSLFLPPNIPQFSGFNFEEDKISENSLINYLLIRGITLPSLKYNNVTTSLDVMEEGLSSAIKHYEKSLQMQENVQAGLLTGPEDCWQFSVLIFICNQIARNAHSDIQRLMDDYKRNNET